MCILHGIWTLIKDHSSVFPIIVNRLSMFVSGPFEALRGFGIARCTLAY